MIRLLIVQCGHKLLLTCWPVAELNNIGTFDLKIQVLAFPTVLVLVNNGIPNGQFRHILKCLMSTLFSTQWTHECIVN
jgi:hypothetical protein